MKRLKSRARLLAGAFLAIVAIGVPAATGGAIIGGDEASEDYAWMGSLQSSDASHGCGISLIASEWAITAAHCLDNITPESPDVQIRFGSADHTSGGEVVGIAEIHRAPGSGGFHFGADAALIRLSEPVDNTPVAIADESPAVGTDTRLIGWGITCTSSLPPLYHCGQPPAQLREVDLEIGPDAGCSGLIGGLDPATELCVGEWFEGQGGCYGDSGGPAVSQIDGEWQLTGITSRSGQVLLWGQCGIAPTIYTDASAFQDWIRTTTGIPTL